MKDVKGKKVLMVSGVCWESPQQIGDHQLARQFLRSGWQVAFLSDPLTPMHLLKGGGADFKVRFKNYISGGAFGENGRLWNYVPGSLVLPFDAPILKSAWVSDGWQKLTFPNLVNKVRRAGFGEVDVLYLRTPNQAFWLDELTYKASVYRVADFDKAFDGISAQTLRKQKELASRVDLTVYTAQSLLSYVKSLGARSTYYLPNGVDYGHFDRVLPRPPEYESIGGPVALYVGNLYKDTFDFDLLKFAASQLKNVQFVIIGRGAHAKRLFADMDNVHCLGAKPYAEVPSYMQYADVGLIPFAVRSNPDLINAVNPLKLYEYLAAGIPVVSVGWEELRRINSPALLSEGEDGFVSNIKSALDGSWDALALKKFSREHDWQSRFLDLMKEVDRVQGADC